MAYHSIYFLVTLLIGIFFYYIFCFTNGRPQFSVVKSFVTLNEDIVNSFLVYLVTWNPIEREIPLRYEGNTKSIPGVIKFQQVTGNAVYVVTSFGIVNNCENHLK